MGKNKNAAPKKTAAAPKVEEPKVEEQTGAKVEQPQNVTIEDMLNNMTAEERKLYERGLDPNRRVDLERIAHERFFMDPNAAKNTGMSQEFIDKINKVTAAMQVSSIICEVVLSKNPHALLLPQELVDAVKLVGAEMGVSLKQNLLPAPNAEGKIEVPSTAIVVDAKTKKAVKDEAKVVEEKPELNPEKIKDEKELREAAIYVLADTKTNVKPYNRINAIIDLYYSWLYFQAADDAAKEELKKRNRADLLEELTTIVGPCPFSMHGISSLLYNETSKTKSPIPAFCLLRNNTMDAKGHPTIDDHVVADFVKVLVKWNAASRIADTEESIAVCKQNIETLSKNKKQNKTAIEGEEKKIENHKLVIDSINETVTYVTSPSDHPAAVFMEAYNDKAHDDFKLTHRLAQQLFHTYYPGVDIKEVETECMMHNAQQYIGVVTNFFRDPLSQFIDYKESNIVELKMKEAPKEEDSKKE